MKLANIRREETACGLLSSFLNAYIFNTLYIRNFYFVILFIFSIFSISFIPFSISTNLPNITILALLISCLSISFISYFTISFNLYILYPLYCHIRIIQIHISSDYITLIAFALLTTLQLAPTLTIVLNYTYTRSLLPL